MGTLDSFGSRRPDKLLIKKGKKMDNFKFIKDRKRHAQTFDKDNICLTKAGQTYNVYEAIQKAREDTEIYPTLDKYGCIDKLQLNIDNAEKFYQDIQEVKDLRGVIDQQHKATALWEALPLEVRAEFGHSMNEFTQKGEQWLKNKIESFKKANEEPKNQELPFESEVNNEQK